MLRSTWSKKNTIGAILGVLTWALLLGPVAPAWTSPLQHPYRQTMPLTPPATWTPVAQEGEAEATPNPRPTALPTRESSGSGGSSNNGTGDSSGNGSSDAKAVPWLELTSDAAQVTPGQTVLVQVTWANLGDAALMATTVQIALPGGMELVSMEASMGQIAQAETGDLAWPVPTLAPGQEARLNIVLRTPEGLWPGTQILLRAQTMQSGMAPMSAELPLYAPEAILPMAGRS